MRQCLSPRVIIRNEDGSYQYIGFVEFDWLKNKSYKLVPCRQCFNCKMKYSSQWVKRCQYEAMDWKHIYFITLTYNNENLPENGLLYKPDYQKFFKRLRKDKHVFRYFLCGEYGPKTLRPHYHFIMFTNEEITDLKKIGKYYTSPYYEKKWRKGFITICPALDEAISYVAMYTTKKINKKIHEKFLDAPEFIVCSKKPALGVNYLKEHMEEFVNNSTDIPRSLLRFNNFDYLDYIDIKERRQEFVKQDLKFKIEQFGNFLNYKEAEKSRIKNIFFKRDGV